MASYCPDVLMHRDKVFDLCLARDATVQTPAIFPVFHFIDLYPTHLDLIRLYSMPHDGNEVEVSNSPGGYCSEAAASWVKL